MDMNTHDLSADQPRAKGGQYDRRLNADPESALTDDDNYSKYDDQAAVFEMLETAKHFTPEDAANIAAGVSQTSWGVRYRLGELSSNEEVDALILQARKAINHLDGQLPDESLASAEVAVTDALVAAHNFRHLGSEDGWGLSQYDEMTEPWHNVVGTAHPSEAEPPDAALLRAQDETEDPRYEHYDSMAARMDLADLEPLMTYVPDGRAAFFDPSAPAPF